MRNKQNDKKKKLFFLILLFFITSFLSLKSFKKVYQEDIKIYGSKLFLDKDILKNSNLNLPKRLIFIKTKYLEKELKRNLSLKNVSVNRQIIPFGLKIILKTRTSVAYGEREINGNKISGFIDEDGFFINKENTEVRNEEKFSLQVFGWETNFRKTLSTILKFQKNENIDLIKISFSKNGYLSLEEKDLKNILLGFNPNIIESQLQIIKGLKDQLNKKNFTEKIDTIDLTDPKNPKIKVFKP